MKFIVGGGRVRRGGGDRGDGRFGSGDNKCYSCGDSGHFVLG